MVAYECEDDICLNPDASYVDFDPGFPLPFLEQALMREPGPLSGDDFDAQDAFARAKTSGAADARGWAEAILEQVHPDYADDVQDVITFNPTIDGVPEEPPEEYRDVQVVGANHFAILLDASGSMAEQSGGSSRMDQAKSAIEDFVDRLPAGSTVSLRVYGQEGSNAEVDQPESCASTEVVYAGDQDGLAGSLEDVDPVGWTPLALAVEESAQDIPEEASDAIVYVVTDGIETCDGDPVAATEALATQGIEPVINVIGFQVGDDDTRQLRDMARAGGGQYSDVSSGADLQDYWQDDMSAMMEAWSEWRRDALDTISEQGRDNMARAEVSGRAVMDSADSEWDDVNEVIDLMKADESIDSSTANAVWNELYGRNKAIWRWGYENKKANWSQAYEQKNLSWSNAYELGNDSWSQYYQQKREGPQG
ncbi:MAG: VWA domain-containing protein [Ornithinimicrobium sp.]